jgi:TonB-dependent SusC/RagA subfamily outer membrane receptor
MRKFIKLSFVSLILLLRLPLDVVAQSASDAGGIIQGTVTDSRDGDALVGVNIVEIDDNNRVVSGTVTDINGRYVLKVKSLNSTLSTSYVGYNKQEKSISGNVVNFVLSETSVAIKEVDIVAAKRQTQSGYSIPIREIATSMQTLETKDLEGIQVSSFDEALQGRIAGLDIVANSSDPGTGSSMRIRGVTSITGNNQPLIVVNDVPYEYQIDPNFDYAYSNQEQYANMLSINPDDILEITVLKDAGASAIWGSKGANGVIMITTKRGASGPTRVDYTYRFTRTVQPRGLKMLNGDNFTMLMKEAYFNPRQDKNASDIPEYNYDPNNPNYEQYNNNTDWISAVTQVGQIHDHYVTVSGGGERANFRISGGFLNQDGTIIGQKYNRVSSRSNLDYRVSDRIKFFAEFSLTNSENDRSYKPVLGIAYQKMPNVSIFEQDRNGNDTDVYYNIPLTSSLSDGQRKLENPVALALLAKNRLKTSI